MKRILLLMIVCVAAFPIANAQNNETPAFPGAEGHGRYTTTGGRGGSVYYVTNLNDDNSPGSLRYAVNRVGIRTILFSVSGTIHLKSNLSIKNGNLTIAGQSAPGDGICLADFPLVVDADNVIIRFIRCRMGDEKITNSDGADAIGGRKRKNIIVDHCSVSWCTDECASFYENENLTFQWNLVSESLRLSTHSKGSHGYGAIWGGMKASFHHNLLAHHDSRVPRLGPGANSTPTNESVDMRNNVFYNYNGNGCYGGEAMHVNIVNNYYKPGPANNASGAKKGRIVAIDKKTDDSYPKIKDVWGTFYINGNVVEGTAAACVNATKDNWTYGVYNQFHSSYGTVSQTTKDTIRLSEPLETGYITTHTAEKAYEQVLKYAGCSFKRDALDERIIEETRTGTALYKGLSASNVSPYPRPGIIDSQNDSKPANAGDDWSAWPLLNSLPASVDNDNDGIPDGWLDANYPGCTAGQKNEEGYTYLEVYLNDLVKHITEGQNEGGIPSGIQTVGIEPVKIDIFLDRNTDMLTIISELPVERMEIFSLSGILMKYTLVHGYEYICDLSGFPSGVYLLRALLEGDKEFIVKKIVKGI